MVSIRAFLSAVSVVAVALAQTPRVAFTSVPAVAVAGQSYNISWAGGDPDSSVTLTLRKGPSADDLRTIGIIADGIRGNSYNWEVNTGLATDDDYALQIQQGQGQINYSGFFSIVNGTGTASISYSGLPTSTSNSSSSTGSSTSTITGGASSGFSTTMSRNMTFSSPTITAPSTTTTTSRSTSTTASSTPATTPNAAVPVGSSAALVMGIFGAIMFLQ